MLRYNLRYQLLLIVVDALIVVAALALSQALRTNIDFGAEALTENGFSTPLLLYPIAVLLWLFGFGQAKVYTPAADMRFRLIVRRLITGQIMASLLFLGALYITYRDFSRLQTLYFLALVFVLAFTARVLLWRLRPRLTTWVNNQRVVLIVGVGASAKHLGEVVRASSPAGLTLAGYVSVQPDDTVDPALADRVLGTVDDLPALVRAHQVDEVVIDTRWFDEQIVALIRRIMPMLEALPVNVRLAHDYSELAYFRATSEDFNGMTLVSLRESVLSPAQRIVKRLFDIAFSTLFLIAAAPLMLIIAIAIRLDSPGSVIYPQMRVGQHGRRFTIYKFRTMVQNADQIKPMGGKDKTSDDERVTRVGKFLRRTSLDELPQFVNVLRGDMSVVGPRPEIDHLAAQYEAWQRKRLEVPQGITGWWQVNGRSDRPMQFHTEDDLFYVRNYSLWLDIQIIFRTVVAVITGRGAY